MSTSCQVYGLAILSRVEDEGRPWISGHSDLCTLLAHDDNEQMRRIVGAQGSIHPCRTGRVPASPVPGRCSFQPARNRGRPVIVATPSRNHARRRDEQGDRHEMDCSHKPSSDDGSFWTRRRKPSFRGRPTIHNNSPACGDCSDL